MFILSCLYWHAVSTPLINRYEYSANWCIRRSFNKLSGNFWCTRRSSNKSSGNNNFVGQVMWYKEITVFLVEWFCNSHVQTLLKWSAWGVFRVIIAWSTSYFMEGSRWQANHSSHARNWVLNRWFPPCNWSNISYIWLPSWWATEVGNSRSWLRSRRATIVIGLEFDYVRLDWRATEPA